MIEAQGPCKMESTETTGSIKGSGRGHASISLSKPQVFSTSNPMLSQGSPVINYHYHLIMKSTIPFLCSPPAFVFRDPLIAKLIVVCCIVTSGADENEVPAENLEVASTYFEDEKADTEDFRRELEKLQIATIYSLVEEVKFATIFIKRHPDTAVF